MLRTSGIDNLVRFPPFSVHDSPSLNLSPSNWTSSAQPTLAKFITAQAYTALTVPKFAEVPQDDPPTSDSVPVIPLSGYLWILFQFSALLLTCLLATRQAREAYKSAKDAESRRLQTRQVSFTRPRFLIGLASALWARLAASAISVLLFVFFPVQTKFPRVILFCVPSLLLLSGYSIATLFWLELNARVHFRDSAVYRPSVTLINAVFYLVFVAGFAVAHGHRASYELRIIAFILQGAAFIMTAAAWIYCGRRVLVKFMAASAVTPPASIFASGCSRSSGPKNVESSESTEFASPSPLRDRKSTRSVCVRMALLTVLCPMFFLTEGAACWYLAVRMLEVRVPLQNFVSHFSTTAFLLFCCEWIPTVIVVSVFRNPPNPAGRRRIMSGEGSFSDAAIDQPLLVDEDTDV